MRVRLAEHPNALGHSSEFNTHSLNEVIVYYDEGGADSEYFHKLEVWLSDQRWLNLRDALQQNLVIPDNYNTHFREPKSEVEMTRGWFDS